MRLRAARRILESDSMGDILKMIDPHAGARLASPSRQRQKQPRPRRERPPRKKASPPRRSSGGGFFGFFSSAAAGDDEEDDDEENQSEEEEEEEEEHEEEEEFGEVRDGGAGLTGAQPAEAAALERTDLHSLTADEVRRLVCSIFQESERRDAFLKQVDLLLR